MRLAFILFLVTLNQHLNASSENVNISINFDKPLGRLQHFWKSTGLCPPDPHEKADGYLLSKDMLLNFALIGSLPFQGIDQVRIHWLLDLIHHSDNTTYDWTSLDILLDRLYQFRLRPGFELMGNPGNRFRDFNNPYEVQLWRDLIHTLATRYIRRFGILNVSRWRFETWNEPDLKSYNLFQFNLTSFLNYFHACREGLDSAVSQTSSTFKLILGGPAGLFRSPESHVLCWGLVNYCAATDKRCLDFLSFHKKGNESTEEILDQDLNLARELKEKFPKLKNIPLVNDESDPVKRWSKPLDWRADARYGAMIARTIIDHQRIMISQEKFPLELLGNDNGFLSYFPHQFTQRTLLARFQMNNTDPPHVQMFIKPVYSTMALLSLLYSQEIISVVDPPNKRVASLVTFDQNKDNWSSSVLITFSEDTIFDPQQILNVSIKVNSEFPPGLDVRFTIYVVNNIKTNPMAIWEKNGSPAHPSFHLRETLRANQGPHRLSDWLPYKSISFSLSLPSVSLLQICSRPKKSPGQVHRLQILQVNKEEILLIWDDSHLHTRCLKTYEIQIKTAHYGFKRMKKKDSILPSFQTEINETAAFRVRVIDAWDRIGQWSKISSWQSY